MAKQNSASKGTAGMAEWLPLLGSICQALASIAEEEQDRRPAVRKVPEEDLGAPRKAG